MIFQRAKAGYVDPDHFFFSGNWRCARLRVLRWLGPSYRTVSETRKPKKANARVNWKRLLNLWVALWRHREIRGRVVTTFVPQGQSDGNALFIQGTFGACALPRYVWIQGQHHKVGIRLPIRHRALVRSTPKVHIALSTSVACRKIVLCFGLY